MPWRTIRCEEFCTKNVYNSLFVRFAHKQKHLIVSFLALQTNWIKNSVSCCVCLQYGKIINVWKSKNLENLQKILKIIKNLENSKQILKIMRFFLLNKILWKFFDFENKKMNHFRFWKQTKYIYIYCFKNVSIRDLFVIFSYFEKKQKNDLNIFDFLNFQNLRFSDLKN